MALYLCKWRGGGVLSQQKYLQKTRYVWHCIYVSGEMEESCHSRNTCRRLDMMALYICKWRGGGVLSQQKYLQMTRYVQVLLVHF